MKPEVPIGPTSVAGWGTALSAFIVAGIMYVSGDHTAQSVTSVEIAGAGVLVLGITHVFRYLQAKQPKGAVADIEKALEGLGLNGDEIAKAIVTTIEERGGLTVQLPATVTGGEPHAQAA